MAVRYESSCCDCPSVGLPCIGKSCRNHDPYPEYTCDKCNHITEILFRYDNEELCEDCLTEKFAENFSAAGEGPCEKCGDYVYDLRDVDGEKLCPYCIGEMFKDECRID